MLRLYLLKFIRHPLSRLLVILALVPLAVPVGSYGLKTVYRPGPVSDRAARGTALNGYSSHAEFEKECSHCHAPLHCITANRCQDCHLDIAKQRADAVGLHGVLPGTARCQTCHIEHRGRDAVISQVPLANIDHGQLTGFSLALHTEDYAGDPLVCDDCHIGHQFAPQSVDCINCHADHDPILIADHRAEFGDRCLECHDGRDRMRAFDHDQVYPLAGAHAEVACQDCHADHVYVGTAADCAACHQEPALHAGQFGFRCDQCHTAAAWAPAQFRLHPFLAALGSAGDLPCQVCHVDSYTHYPCDSCHDRHEMRTVHLALDIDEIDDCTGCHPTGPGQIRLAPGADDPLRLLARPTDPEHPAPTDAPGPHPATPPAADRGPGPGPDQGEGPADQDGGPDSSQGGDHGPTK
jgi:hypothetical protein